MKKLVTPTPPDVPNPLKHLDLTEGQTFGIPSAGFGFPSAWLGFPSARLGFPSARLGIPSVRLGNGSLRPGGAEVVLGSPLVSAGRGRLGSYKTASSHA